MTFAMSGIADGPPDPLVEHRPIAHAEPLLALDKRLGHLLVRAEQDERRIEHELR